MRNIMALIKHNILKQKINRTYTYMHATTYNCFNSCVRPQNLFLSPEKLHIKSALVHWYWGVTREWVSIGLFNEKRISQSNIRGAAASFSHRSFRSQSKDEEIILCIWIQFCFLNLIAFACKIWKITIISSWKILMIIFVSVYKLRKLFSVFFILLFHFTFIADPLFSVCLSIC